MIQEQKQLLLKDLCARLSYGIKLNTPKGDGTLNEITLSLFGHTVGVNIQSTFREYLPLDECKPYLRSTLSMTEEELYIIESNWAQLKEGNWLYECVDEIATLLNSHHFDYRGLIEKGLALEAPDGMYKTE